MKLYFCICLLVISMQTSVSSQNIKHNDTINIEIQSSGNNNIINATINDTDSKSGLLIVDNQTNNTIILLSGSTVILSVEKKSKATKELTEGLRDNYKVKDTEDVFIPKKPTGEQVICKIGDKKIPVLFTKAGSPSTPPSGNGTTTTKPKTALKFIPSKEEEKDFRLQAPVAPGCEGIPLKNVDYEIVYNMQEGRYCYFKDGSWVDTRGSSPKNYFRPREGKDLYFRIAGYSPYSDSLSVSVEFENRNEKLEGDVLSQLMPGLMPSSAQNQSGQSGTTTGTNGSNPVGDSQSTKEEIDSLKRIAETTDLVTGFRNEMKQFYLDKKNHNENSLAFIKACVDYIQVRVRGRFWCEGAEQPPVLLNCGHEIIDAAIKDTTKRKEAYHIFEEGVRYYSRIIDYEVRHFPHPVQIKNADITTITFKHFRNGKEMAPAPSAFSLFNTGGFKIDFSTGLVVHGLREHRFTTIPDSLKNITITEGTPPDTMISYDVRGQIVRERNSQVAVDAVLLAHFYTRNPMCRRINWSGTLGIVPSKQNDDLRIRYLAGGSVLFGSEQRLVLSAGIIAGKVSRLAEGLKYKTEDEKGSIIATPQGQSVAVPTRDLMRASFFISATFNFASVSPQKKTDK